MNVNEEVDFDFFETPRNEDSHGGKQNINIDKYSHTHSDRKAEKHGGLSNGSHSRDRNASDSRRTEKGRNRSYSSSSSESETDSETPRYGKESSKSTSVTREVKPTGKKKYKSASSSASSSAYSNSDFSSEESGSDVESVNKEKIDIRMPNPQKSAWESESRSPERSDKRLIKRSPSVSSGSESDYERERNVKKSSSNRVKSAKRRDNNNISKKNKQKSLRSRSSSYSNNSDITDVSPLESPENSPRFSRKQYNDNKKDRHVQYDTQEDDPNIKLETDQIDLSILMKCMADIDKEKQQRIKNNSRRVAFASTSAVGEKQQKGNYTFSVGRAKVIEKENQRLLKQIMNQMHSGGTTKNVTGSVHRGPKRATQPVVQRLTPSAVNRMKEQRRIEMENMQMLGRLSTVRPTRGMSREEQIDDADRIMSYGLPSGTMVMPGDTYYDHKPYRVTHSSMSHTAGSIQRSRPSSAKSNASVVIPGKRSRPSSAKSNASMVSNVSMRSNVSKRSTRSNISTASGVRRMADGRVDRRPTWDDRFSFA